MDFSAHEITNLAQWLPKQLNFYHLGQVEQKNHPLDLSDSTGVSFRIFGEFNAMFLIFFEKSLDYSTYTELGNLLVSGLITQLQNDKGIVLMISPPKNINSRFFEYIQNQLANQPEGLVRKTYIHSYNNFFIPVETIILPIPSEGFGYV